MQYKALYRKYRPFEFDDVVGQNAIIKTLINSIKEKKIGHAYLFTGTRGTGKTSVAKMFAKAINCEDLSDGMPCGKCTICKIINSEENPDIIEIDAASNNGVDEIREIKNKATLVPVLCKYKVYIIDEVHMLSIGAFNALLKTLEEPPSHSIFILATTEPQKIPVTIISRCQRFDFKRIPLIDIQKKLKYISKKEDITINDECILEIAKLSDGSLRDAIGLLDQVNSFSEENITIEKLYELSGNLEISKIVALIENIVSSNIDVLIEMYDDLNEIGKNFQKISENMLEVLTNVLIYKNAKKYFDKKNIYYSDEISKLDKILNREKLNYLISELNELLEKILRSSNPSLLFELFLLKTIELSDENIKSEIVEEKEIINIEIKEENDSYKDAMVNNTIALADKDCKTEIKKLFCNLDKYLLDYKQKNIVALLMDCNINAASNDHLLLTYKYDNLVQEHDKYGKKIEKIINDLTKRKYKVVAISEERWKELRPKFVELKNKNKTIELMEETYEDSIPCLVEEKTEYDKIIDEFGIDVIEMEEQ